MDQKKFIKISNVIGLILSFSFIVIFSIVGFSLKDNSYIYGTLVSIPFLFMTIWASGKVVDVVFSLGKKQTKKWRVIILAMFLYICKYLIMVLPLLIATMTNYFTGQVYFHLSSSIIGVLSYPITTMIVQIFFIGKKPKNQTTV